MVKLVAGSGGLNMLQAGEYFARLLDATVTTANAAKVVIADPDGFEATVKGSGFTYDPLFDFPIGGTITSIRAGGAGLTAVSITDLSLDIDQIWAPQGSPLLDALGGDDRIFGSRDAGNVLFGLGGDDLIVGGAQADILSGGDATPIGTSDGADTLNGGRGGDTLAGEAGADAYVYKSILDSRKSDPDQIFGLEDADRIDLRAIDANISKDGNQAFEIVEDFSGKAGELKLEFSIFSYDTTVSLDVDGDAKADMAIVIDGLFTFHDYSDFTNFVL